MFYLSNPIMVDFIMSQVGQMMSLVESDPHHEKTGNS